MNEENNLFNDNNPAEEPMNEMPVNEPVSYESPIQESTYEQPTYESPAQENSYEQSPYESAAQEEPVHEAAEPPKKKKGIGKRIAIGLVSALTIGAVAGAACVGTAYLGFHFLPITSDSNTNQNSNANTAQGSTISNNSTITTTNVNVSATVMDVSEIVKSVITSVVEIDGTYTYTTSSSNFGYWGAGQSQTYQSPVSGSGIVIGQTDTELLIVTNHHVVADMDDGTIEVTFYDGSTCKANVKGTDSAHDLAVIAISLDSIPSDAIYSIAKIGDSTATEVGDAAIAIGNSMGYGISVTTGIVSALGRSVTVDNVVYENLIQTDAAINSGNSGGALFNSNGEVIGINSVKMNNTSSTNVEGMGYAISISYVQDIIDELSTETTKIKLSDDERGYLGITGVTITESISSTYGYPVGALIRSVAGGSAADAAGLVKNDIIVAFDGETITTYDDLYNMMFYYPIGAEVEVQYYHMTSRGEFELQTATVVLTDKNAISE